MGEISRYHRQVLLPQVGEAGQARLGKARVVVVGLGALGCVIAEQLARAGVGFLRVVDRDVVEWTNLQRQGLYGEADAAGGVAKAEAAGRRLGEINSGIEIEAVATDVWGGNVEDVVRDVDLIFDGTDNVQTRYLLNDVAVKRGIAWVQGGCVGMEGRVMGIIPGRTACLRCVYPTPPAGGELATCDTAGVLGAAAGVVGSLQVVAGIKILMGVGDGGTLQTVDVWSGRVHHLSLDGARREECACCGGRRFEFLEGGGGASVALCGRNAVQVRPERAWRSGDFENAAERLRGCGSVEEGRFFARCWLTEPAGMTLTLFRDGRVVVDGTNDLGRGKSLYSRFIGT